MAGQNTKTNHRMSGCICVKNELSETEGLVRWIGASSAVMQTLHGSVMVKREPSPRAKLSMHRSIFVPTFTDGHEFWVVTERTRLRVQAAERSHRRVAGLSFRGRETEADLSAKLQLYKWNVSHGLRLQSTLQGKSLNSKILLLCHFKSYRIPWNWIEDKTI